MSWGSFVAVGDSFTEGLDDPHPDGSGYRGWADRVAARLAAEHRAANGGSHAAETPGFRYANLAVRGRLFDAIVDTQVPAALRMRPELISFAGGGNNVLRRRFDAGPMLARFAEVVSTMRAAGADVIIFRWANVTVRLPGRRIIGPRMQVLNAAVGEVAEKYGAILVDLWQDEEFHNPRLWSEDRLHLSASGHRRVAAHVLTALGIEPEASWFAAAEPPLRRTWITARAHDLRWARQHLAPWVRRRLAGTSSGDLVGPKRPVLGPVADGWAGPDW